MILNSPYISGSLTVTGNIIASGSVTLSGSVASASFATTASNALTLDGLNSASFAPSSTFNTVSSSYAIVSASYSSASGSLSTRVTNVEATASTNTQASASFAVVSASYASASGSLSTRVTNIEGNYATTGSNVFTGAQTVCANITSTGTIIAQTLNVQQVTSSIVYSSGSNIFGCSTGDVQQITGSLRMTGSIATFSTNCFGIGTSTPLAYNNYVALTVGDNSTTKTGLIKIRSCYNAGDGAEVYQTTAGTFTIATNGSDSAFRIFSNNIASFTCQVCAPSYISTGNVGVGTAPYLWRTGLSDVALDVGATTGLYYQTGGSTVLFNNAYRCTGNNIVYKTTGTGVSAYWQNSDGSHNWNIAPSGTANCSITFNQAMTLTCAGNLLINKTNDTGGPLQVSNASNMLNFIWDVNGVMLSSVNNANTVYKGFQFDALSYSFFTSAGNADLTITSTGNVGVGTTNPVDCIIGSGTILEVAGTGGGSVKLRYTSATNYGEFSLYKGTNGSYIDSAGATTAANNDLIFRTAGAASYGVTERLRIRSGGEISFMPTTWNYTNPSTTFRNSDFGAGGLLFRDSTDAYITSNTYYNTGGDWVAKYTTSTGIGLLKIEGGNLSWITHDASVTAASTYALTGRFTITRAGIACFSTTVCAPCFATISDYRMKSNLRPIEGLSIIMNTKPYKFDYNYDCSTSFGMIAHELQDVLPEAVFGHKDGEVMQGVDYMKLLPIAIKAIQEQQCKINILESCLGIN